MENQSKDCEAPIGFVLVQGGTIIGAKNTNNSEGVFIEGRTVTLSSFYMGKYEVTQAEYKEVMQNQKVTVNGTEYTLGAEPSEFIEANKSMYDVDFGTDYGNRPVERVTWYDAVYYCNARSEKEGLTPAYNITVTTVEETFRHHIYIKKAAVTLVENADGYRLPTEAEWEYAARGGDQSKADWNYVFSGADTAKGKPWREERNRGMDAVGWYQYNNDDGTTGNLRSRECGIGTHEVGKKKANRLGLYDMSGNVSEWCYDLYDKISSGEETNPVGPASGPYSGHVNRGGSWNNYACMASVSVRNTTVPNCYSSSMGFRVVRSVSK